MVAELAEDGEAVVGVALEVGAAVVSREEAEDIKKGGFDVDDFRLLGVVGEGRKRSVRPTVVGDLMAFVMRATDEVGPIGICQGTAVGDAS